MKLPEWPQSCGSWNKSSGVVWLREDPGNQGSVLDRCQVRTGSAWEASQWDQTVYIRNRKR